MGICNPKYNRFEDVIINDLGALTKNAPKECYSDMTHLGSPQGRKLLGDRVSEVIGIQLGVELDSAEGYDEKAHDFYLGA